MRCKLDWLAPILWVFCCLPACSPQPSTPKPRGYFRIDLPARGYQHYQADCPFTFDYPLYANLVMDHSNGAESCWMNVEFPAFNGTLHLSYKAIESPAMFRQLAEDARDFAYKHSVKATDIEETELRNPAKKVYGIYYSIEGNTASSAQFFLTDSVHHYLRGALYFNERPKVDSLAPVLHFVQADLHRMIESFSWK